jgi:hypothetical protein
VTAHFPGVANSPQGWRLRLNPDVALGEAPLRLELRSSSGLVGLAYVQPPGPCAMTYSGWSRRRLSAEG